jgi:hypothetical protein
MTNEQARALERGTTLYWANTPIGCLNGHTPRRTPIGAGPLQRINDSGTMLAGGKEAYPERFHTDRMQAVRDFNDLTHALIVGLWDLQDWAISGSPPAPAEPEPCADAI